MTGIHLCFLECIKIKSNAIGISQFVDASHLHASKQKVPVCEAELRFWARTQGRAQFDEKTDLTTPPDIHASSVTSSSTPKDTASKKGREKTKYMDKPLGNVVEVFSSEFQYICLRNL